MDGSFFTPMLGDNVGAGPPFPLRLPPFTTDIIPIPNASPDQMRTVFGVAVRGWEVDTSSNSWRVDRLEDWKRSSLTRLNHALRTAGFVESFHTSTPWHVTFTWEDNDDAQSHHDSEVFSYNDLLSLIGASPRELVFDLRGGDSHYRLRANLSVTGPPENCEP